MSLRAVLGAVMTLAIAATAAQAYTFGSSVTPIGPEVRQFDWSAQKCSDDDIPDQATRAFRDVNGQVILINSHHTTRKTAGPSLAGATHTCTIMMGSGKNSDPSKYDDREWLASTYTPDGRTVYGLIHAEYQGYNQAPGYCIKPGETFADKQKCWYNALTLTTSTNNGATFQHATPPNHYVAGPPYRYAVGIGPIGFFQPSNIVRGKDGYLYILTHTEDYGVQPIGSCLMRTNRIDDPTSWRMWDGSGFNRRIRDPYRYTYPPEEGVCQPVSPWVGTMSESLTWNTYFKKWMLVGAWDGQGNQGPGFYYFLSDDLINWSAGKLVMNGVLPWTFTCSNTEQVRDPSLLDNDSKSRNFDTVGQRPFIYFTRFQISNCSTSLDRDLIRIPLEFSNQQPGGPSASLSASTLAPQTGQQVTFDASGSADADGSIAAYQWDLDGDGLYELNTGTDPTASAVYGAPDKVIVTVRVCDDDGKGTDETRVLDVSGPEVTAQPQNGQPSSGACGQAPGGGGGSGGSGSGGGGTAGGGGGTAGGGGSQGGGEGGSAAGSAPGAPVAASVPAGNPAIGLFRLVGKPSARADGSLVLRLLAPAAGRFTVRGVGSRAAIRPVSTNASKAGTVALTVRPSRAGKTLLRRKGRARVRVTLAFTPVGGALQKSTRVLTLKRTRSR